MRDPFTVYGGRGFTFLASPVLVTSPPQANEPQNSLYLNTYARGSASKHQIVPLMPQSQQRGFSSRPSRLADFSSASHVEEG